MRITVIGSGYVGLVSGACFADFGHEVTCVDKDPAKIKALRSGNIPIYEQGLAELVAANSDAGRLKFTSDVAAAVRGAAAVFLAVGTPAHPVDGHADLSDVFAAAGEVADALSGYTAIVTKSTVPVGTGDEIERIIRERRPDADFTIVSNPEFLREGTAVRDFQHPDRIVIGTDDERARELVTEVYRPLVRNHANVMYTSRRAAELIKYAANAFLAIKLTFINEVADLCESVGANVQEVARGIGLDNRIGPSFLLAGPGFGGSCFPKDMMALIKTGQDHAAPLRIVETAVASNDARKRAMARKISGAIGGNLHGKTIGVLGLTFKPNTDDLREAPAIPIIMALLARGASVRAHDPVGMARAKPMLPEVRYCDDPYQCAEGASALVIVTEWDQFRGLDFGQLARRMARPILVDLRNVYRPEEVTRHGFTYHGVGQPAPDDAPATEPALVVQAVS